MFLRTIIIWSILSTYRTVAKLIATMIFVISQFKSSVLNFYVFKKILILEMRCHKSLKYDGNMQTKLMVKLPIPVI